MADRQELLQRKRDLLLKRRELLTQSPLQKIGSALGTGLRAGVQDVRTEVLSPIASGLSTAAFGLPRAALRRFAPETEESVFPEQTTAQGKALRGIADFRGFIKGGATKLAKKAGELVPKGAGRTATQFGTFGTTQLEAEPTVGGQFGRGAGFALLGAGGAKVAPKVVDTFRKLKSDFINTSLVPRVTKLFSDTLEKFPQPIQDFAKNTAKIPENIIKHISQRRPATIRQSSQALDNNADNIFVGMNTKMSEKGQQVTDAYVNSLKKVGDVNIQKSVSTMESVLKKHGFVDELGDITQRVKDPLADPILKTIAGEFQALRGTSGPGTTIAERAGSVRDVNKFIWDNLKDRLSKINAKGGKLSPDITKILDRLHLDAENAGAAGIQKARSLAREFFRKQEISDKFIAEKQIDKIFKLTGEESRNFKELDRYLGGGFEQKAKDLVANNSLRSLEQLSQSEVFGQESKLVSKLKSAQSKAEFERIKNDFIDLFGNTSEVQSIFKELNSFRRTQLGAKIIGGSLIVGGGISAGRNLIRRPIETVFEGGDGGGDFGGQ